MRAGVVRGCADGHALLLLLVKNKWRESGRFARRAPSTCGGGALPSVCSMHPDTAMRTPHRPRGAAFRSAREWVIAASPFFLYLCVASFTSTSAPGGYSRSLARHLLANSPTQSARARLVSQGKVVSARAGQDVIERLHAALHAPFRGYMLGESAVCAEGACQRVLAPRHFFFHVF